MVLSATQRGDVDIDLRLMYYNRPQQLYMFFSYQWISKH